MDRINAMVAARVVAVNFFLGAIMCALMALVIPMMFMSLPAQTPDGTSVPAVAGFIFASILLVVGAFLVLVGWGLWTYRNWARIVMIILAALGIFLSLFYIIMGAIFGVVVTAQEVPSSSFVIMFVVMGLFGIAFNVFIIWLFGFQVDVRAVFGPATPVADAATAPTKSVVAKSIAKKKR